MLRYARSHFQIPKVLEDSQRGENTKEPAESAQRGDPESSYRFAGEEPTASLMRCGSSKRATVHPRATARLPHSPGNPEQAGSPPSRSVRMREWALPHETCSTCVSWGLSRGSGTGEGSSTYSYPLAETRTASVTARHAGGEALPRGQRSERRLKARRRGAERSPEAQSPLLDPRHPPGRIGRLKIRV